MCQEAQWRLHRYLLHHLQWKAILGLTNQVASLVTDSGPEFWDGHLSLSLEHQPAHLSSISKTGLPRWPQLWLREAAGRIQGWVTSSWTSKAGHTEHWTQWHTPVAGCIVPLSLYYRVLLPCDTMPLWHIFFSMILSCVICVLRARSSLSLRK